MFIIKDFKESQCIVNSMARCWKLKAGIEPLTEKNMLDLTQ